MTSHLEEGLLQELLDGEIPSAELAPVQVHLAGCAECRARLTEAREFQSVSDRLIEVLDRPVPSPRRREAAPIMLYRYPWKRNLAWAATLVAAVGIGYYGRGSGPAPQGDARLTIPAPAAESAANRVGSGVANTQPSEPATPALPAAPPKVLADKPAERDAAAETKGAAGRAKAAQNELQRLDQLSTRPESVAAPAAVTAPPPERRAAAAASRQESREAVLEPRANLTQMAPSPPVTALGALARDARVPERIDFPEAVRRLGGTIRLIEGLVPDRLEALGQEIQVVYRMGGGDLYLRQQLTGGRISFRLIAPADFPADSLEKLRARVRE